MSSDASFPQYSGQPAGPPPQYQQQPYQPQPGPGGYPAGYQPGPPQPNPYVVPGAPGQGVALPGGGQPPHQPPGAYVPVPPPPPGRRNTGKVAIAAILSVALVAAAAAIVLFKFVFVTGPDPAESFPASASMYVEINFDPSFDQTPKLLDHLGKFGELDYDSTDDMIADLLEESGLEGIDAEKDLTSWLGKRHGLAMWEHDDQQYAVISLASTDSGAAEDGLAKFRSAAGADEDQFAYTVEDDHVLMVVGETGAKGALKAAESEAGSAPLSTSSAYEEAREWLDGDQLIVYWVDMDAIVDLAELSGEASEAELLRELYSGELIAGLSAFDEGFELTYRLFGDEKDPWTGSADLISNMGDMPAGDFAAAAYLPEDLGAIADKWTSLFGDFYGGGGVDYGYEPGAPLTDAEYEEFLDLQTGYYAATLTTEEEDRYRELEDRYWLYGTEDEPWGDYEDPYASDYGDVEEMVGQITDLLAGSSLRVAGDFAPDSVDEESFYVSARLADDRAQELEDLIAELTGGEALPEGVEVDGSEISYTGPGVDSSTLSQDSRFSDFADAAPDQTAIALWIDLAAAGEAYPDDFRDVEALSALAWAHGSVDGDGTGVVRLYLKD